MTTYVNRVFSLLFICVLTSCSTADFNRTLGSLGALNNTDIAAGLKQALQIGIEDGANRLAQVDGYYGSPYKILLPQEARTVVDKLSIIPGWSNVENEITKRLNRAAEDAAKSAAPIFIDAIKSMTITDAKNILVGEKNAATSYFHRVTYNPLYATFNPVIETSLNKFGALDYWADAVNTYNKIPFVDRVDPDLANYVTEKALVGLFAVVEEKEAGIRTDISQRTTDLLRRVFAQQD